MQSAERRSSSRDRINGGANQTVYTRSREKSEEKVSNDRHDREESTQESKDQERRRDYGLIKKKKKKKKKKKGGERSRWVRDKTHPGHTVPRP